MIRPPAKIAVINSSAAVIDMLRTYLEGEGYETVTAHVDDIKAGHLDLVAFLHEHRPAVVLYDISPPYEENWNVLKLVRDSQSAEGMRFVLTTTNKDRLEEAVGPTDTIEIVGKPFDLELIKQAIERP